MSVSLLRQLLMKEAVKKSAGSSGIMTINKNIAADVEKLVQKYVSDAMQQGVDLDTLGPEQLKMIVAMNAKATNRVISGTSPEGRAITEKLFGKQKAPVVDMTGKTIDTSQGIMGGKSVKELMESGQVQKGSDGLKVSEKITNRDMFKNSSLNKVDTVTDTITYIKTLDPMDAMKEANSVIGRKGKYKNLTPEESKKILTDTEDHIFERDIPIDPDDMAKGGRAGYAVGNQVMPAVDSRMNLDYNTLVDQNTAQRGTQAQARNPILQRMQQNQANQTSFGDKIGYTQHNDNNQLLRNALTAGKIDENQYKRMGGYDVAQQFPGSGLTDLALVGGSSLGYNAIKSGINAFNPNDPNAQFGKYGPAESTELNVRGATGLNPTDLQLYNSLINDTYATGPAIMERLNMSDVNKEPISGKLNFIGEGVYDLLNPEAAAAEPSAMPQGSPGQLNPVPPGEQNYFPVYDGELGRYLTEEEYTNRSLKQIAERDNPTMADVAGPSPDAAETYSEYKARMLDTLRKSSNQKTTLTDLQSDGSYSGTSRELPQEDYYNYMLADAYGHGFNPNTGLQFGTDDRGVFTDKYKFNQEMADFKKNNPDYNFVGLASGGRAGYYGGGQAVVGEDLSEIGHGSDSLMARNMQLAPNSMATTSTGLNYLLGQDNDTARVPYNQGGPARQGFKMGKRAFLKLLGSGVAGVAGVKSGIIGLGEGGAKKAVTETVKQAAGSGGQVPPYFLNLVKKIKTMGDDVTSKSATQDRQVVKQYKDFEMTEDISTGEIQIFKRSQSDEAIDRFGGENATEEVFMRYKPSEDIIGKNKKPVKTGPEYEENTSYISNNRENTGGILDDVDGVPDEVVQEGTVFEDTMSEFGKAEGGRIGYGIGGLSRLGINSTSRKFLEKVFGKEKFQTMIQNDPRMHRGMLEVVEMFRNKDKDGLKSYMKNFLPEMNDVEMEKFIVSSGDSAGIEGQLIRLGSGREYKNLINMKKEADQIRKLDDFDIEDVSKNAEGGRIGFSGGGILRAIIAKSAASKGLSVRDFIKATNYKGLPPEVRMYISAEEFAALKGGQKELYENFIDMAKTRKSFQEQVELGKGTPAKPLFDNLEQTMDEKSFVPKTVTSDDIAQMELMVKNRFNKGRKDNAQGGIQTMLGE